MSDGDNFILGTNNGAVSETDLRVTGGGDDTPGPAYGLHVEFLEGDAVGGSSALGLGVEGISFGVAGVKGTSTNGEGVWGTSTNAEGVYGTSSTGVGVRGTSFQVGVQGIGIGGATGVAGVTQRGVGVLGIAQERTGRAGMFEGNVDILGGDIFNLGNAFVTGNLKGARVITGSALVLAEIIAGTVIAGTKFFRIDHPLNPKNKFLVHASVESAEMKTFYDGVVTLDKSGKATVRLPKWFEALNKDFRYQLTPIGAPGPNLHIAEGVTRNRFKIAGGAPSMKVCWQVTGIRQDKFAKDHPLSVEQDKRTVEQDKRSEDIRFLDAQSPRQVEAFNRLLKEDQAKTEALMSAQSQRMEELRKAVQKKK
jgi:hypothetical protein